MAGYNVTAADLNTKAGSLVTSLWDTLDQVHRFKLWLDDASNTDLILTAAPYLIPQADLNVIRPALSDLGSGANGLWAVAHGIFRPAAVNDFFFNAKKLTGTNYTGSTAI